MPVVSIGVLRRDPMNEALFRNDIAPILEAACAGKRVDAVSLALRVGSETFALSRGLANRAEDIAATPETLFHIGSVTKSLTAEIVWSLIAAGRLSADLPVIRAAPELSHIRTLADPRLTVLHLLSHTGGLDGDVIFDAGRDRDVLRRYMAQIREIGSLFAPGEHFSYANIGYGILGRIAELASGGAFEDLLARHLGQTHGLTRFGILPLDKIRQRTALHFVEGKNGLAPDYFGPHSNIASGTVLAMSMGDLVGWAASHFASTATGEVPSLTAAMTQPVAALPHNHRYGGWGAGFTLMADRDETLIGHDGGTAGTSTFLRIAPHKRVAWALSATGSGGTAVYRDVEPILRRLAGLAPAPERVPPGGPVPSDLSVYEGRFVRDGMSFTVRRHDARSLRLGVEGPLAPGIANGLVLQPLSAKVCAMRIPALDASVWVSFHDFDEHSRPRLLFLLERMARRNDGDAR